MQINFTNSTVAKDIESNHFYAIKREPIDMDYPQLHHEHKIYNILKEGRKVVSQ